MPCSANAQGASISLPVTTDRNAPAGVPEGYVITPSGYFHPSCVKQVAEGDIVDAQSRVIRHADGNVEDMQACEYPHYNAKGEIIDFSGVQVNPPSITHSWIEEASVVGSSAYGELNGTWTVPAAPPSNDGQTVYFFTGFEEDPSPATFSILQPVLGWWGGAWSIASWNCCIKGTTYNSTPVVVKAGETIYGTMKNTCAAGKPACATWNVTTTDKTSGKSTTLANTAADGQQFNWAFSGVLEVYSIVKCGDYPPGGGLKISNVQLYDDNFKIVSSPDWSIDFEDPTGSPQCSYGVTPAATSVVLDYGTSTFSVTPGSTLAFGDVSEGSSAWQSFTVENTSTLTVSGKATTSAPFTISSGGSYDLAPGGKQTVTVKFSPEALESYTGTVTFTGDGGAKRAVTGTGVAHAEADLTVTAVSIPTTLAVGGTGEFSATIANRGDALATAFQLGFYISKTDSITSASTLIAVCTYSAGLDVGASSTCAGPIAFPSSLGPGTYYGGARVDIKDQVKESKDNQTLMASHTLTIQ
jgi:hypothetical protein